MPTQIHDLDRGVVTLVLDGLSQLADVAMRARMWALACKCLDDADALARSDEERLLVLDQRRDLLDLMVSDQPSTPTQVH